MRPLVLLYDGYLPTKDHKHDVKVKRGPRKRPKVKEKEQNMNRQPSILPGQTFSHEPGFVKLMEDDPGGIISCTTHPLKAQVSSFPTRPVSAHLEFIWSSKQPQNRRYIFPEANPAKGRMEDDGGPSMEFQDSPKSGNSRAKVKEKVQAILMATVDPPGYTPMPRPGFVIKIANDSEGVSAISDHDQLA